MYEYKARVNRVVDGDTVILDIDLGFETWINNQSVRIYGVDTPESRTKDLDEKARGILAKEWVIKLLPVGDVVFIKTIKDKSEKFGRILGDIINTDDISISASLLENNLGVPYIGQSKEEIKDLHDANRLILIDSGKYIPINED
jgi:micrococcal nuclease